MSIRTATHRFAEFKTRAIATLRRVPASSAIHAVIGVAEAANGNWAGCCCSVALALAAAWHR